MLLVIKSNLLCILSLFNHFSISLGLIVASTAFLLAQLAIIAIWTVFYQRRQKNCEFDQLSVSSHTPQSNNTMVISRDTMSKVYDTGYGGRHF